MPEEVKASRDAAPPEKHPDAPKKSPRWRAAIVSTAKRVWVFARRRTVIIVATAVVVVGANAWMITLVHAWKVEGDQLRVDNTELGQKLADAESRTAFQKDELALLATQVDAVGARSDELQPLADDQKALADKLQDAALETKQCVLDRGKLISNLWTSTAAAQAGLEAKANSECAAAKASVKAIPKES